MEIEKEVFKNTRREFLRAAMLVAVAIPSGVLIKTAIEKKENANNPPSTTREADYYRNID